MGLAAKRCADGVRIRSDARSVAQREMRGALFGLRVVAGKTVTAAAFSARGREPSFYLGLNIGPSLRSALQGRIAYPWGLGPLGPAQTFNGCFPLQPVRFPFVGPVIARTGFDPTLADPGPVYSVASSFFGSYASPLRHTARAIAAI